MPKKLKAAVIGLGVGEKHIEGYRFHQDVEVVGLCDIDGEHLRDIGGRFDISWQTTDPDEILTSPDVDIVSICSFDDCHADQVNLALKHGKHIMVEKPLCLTREEAKSIHASLRTSGKRLCSNLILRESPRFLKLKELVDKGDLGEIYYLEGDYIYGRHWKIAEGWRGKLDFYCVLYGGGLHLVDLMLWLTGEDVEEVFSYGNNICSQGTQFKYEDCIVSVLRFRNGMVGKTMTTFGSIHPHFHELKVYGKKSTFVNTFDAGVHYTEASREGMVLLEEPYPGVHKGALIPKFIDAIVHESQSPVAEREVFRAMDVCFAMHDSLRKGMPVKVDYCCE